MKSIYKIFIFLFFSLTFTSKLAAQTCGFGCLGLSGFYGGYSVEYYDLDGLNRSLSELLESYDIKNSKFNFERGKGFRIGANIFRADFDDYFITAKGFYQFIKDTKQTNLKSADGKPLLESELELNHWGLGLDFGIPLFKFLNWKIVESGVTFFTASLNNKYNIQDELVSEVKYDEPEVKVGFYVGTGLIIHIIRDYISLEGTAVYNIIKIDHLINENGSELPNETAPYKFLAQGGVSATVQINIGVPL